MKLIKLDASTNYQFGFQDPATPIMEGIINLHHQIMVILVLIAIFVLYLLVRVVLLFNSNIERTPSSVNHGTFIEVIWTIIPSIILVIIAIPSFSLIYGMDEILDPAITIKAIGHQWYWSYEYSDYSSEGINFDSYMIPTEELSEGELRLLEVDNRVVVPTNTHIRIIVTSSDVLHSWAVPSLGIKTDAVPGRLNQTSLFIKREGVFYGQCSEICGVNHGFMPIVVHAVSVDNYIDWVSNQLNS